MDAEYFKNGEERDFPTVSVSSIFSITKPYAVSFIGKLPAGSSGGLSDPVYFARDSGKRRHKRSNFGELAVSEILKTYHNAAKDCLLWYYRDKNSNEIDVAISTAFGACGGTSAAVGYRVISSMYIKIQ